MQLKRSTKDTLAMPNIYLSFYNNLPGVNAAVNDSKSDLYNAYMVGRPCMSWHWHKIIQKNKYLSKVELQRFVPDNIFADNKDNRSSKDNV